MPQDIIKGMCIMDNDGNRILAKYYDKNVLSTLKEQKAFEKNLFNKTHRSNTEIIMLDGLTCVYKSNVDLFFYVMGTAYENELILLSVLNCLYDSISLILKKNVEKRLVLENLEIIMLAFDEICDGGWVLLYTGNAVMESGSQSPLTFLKLCYFVLSLPIYDHFDDYIKSSKLQKLAIFLFLKSRIVFIQVFST